MKLTKQNYQININTLCHIFEKNKANLLQIIHSKLWNFQMRMASSVFASWPSSFSVGIVQYWNCEYIGEYYDCPCLSLFVYMTLCHLSSLIFSRFSNFDT